MVVVLLLLVPVDGEEVAAPVLVLLLVELLELLEPPLGLALSFTTVVLLLLPPPAGGFTVSDFCSHAARSAALARMQIYFFIDMGCLIGSKPESEHAARAALRLTN